MLVVAWITVMEVTLHFSKFWLCWSNYILICFFIEPYSVKLIDGINQSEVRHRGLILFCFIYLNVNARVRFTILVLLLICICQWLADVKVLVFFLAILSFLIPSMHMLLLLVRLLSVCFSEHLVWNIWTNLMFLSL